MFLNTKLIYGGTEYSYANDPDFTGVSTSERYWRRVIDHFYEKYQGWAEWHTKLVQTVTQTGKLVMPTGRSYVYSRDERGNWPRTTILNYPVQGLGADVVAVIRVAIYKRLKACGIEAKMTMTVHDSIVIDCPERHVPQVAAIIQSAFDDGPELFEKWFYTPFDLPLRCEISVGPNMDELKEIQV